MLGACKHTSIPRVELSKPDFDKQKRAKHQAKGNAHQSETHSVLLYWSSLQGGFLNKPSLLSTIEIPQSPISSDHSLQLLRSRGGALGAFDNAAINTGTTLQEKCHPLCFSCFKAAIS